MAKRPTQTKWEQPPVLLTPRDVAQKSGKSYQWIRTNIQSGALESMQISGGRYLITQEQYERWVANKKPVGRPKKESL